MNQISEQMGSTQALDEERVMQYLLQNPDFFIRNPYIVEQMVVPHPVRGCVSLLKWQLERQRARIQQLEDDITRLIAHVSINEPLFYHLLRLQSDLAMTCCLQELLNCLHCWTCSLGLGSAHVRLFSDKWQLGVSSISCT